MISQLELMHFASWHARAEIVRHCSAESCILTTCIVSDILREFLGVRTMPVTCGVVAMNAKRWEQYRREENPTSDDGGFGIIIEHHYEGEEPEGWDDASNDPWSGGHLVLVAEQRYMVDASADQFNMPDEGIDVQPLVLDLGDHAADFLDGDVCPGIRTDLGARISWQPFTDDLSYTESPDWQAVSDSDDLLRRRVMTTVEGLLAAVEDAESLPPLPAIPPALKWRDAVTPQGITQAIRSGIELGQIEDSPEAIAQFITQLQRQAQ